MGKRGPPPTPTAILKLRGSWRAKVRKNEPQPESGRPPTPDGLGESASKVWTALLDMLEPMGVLAVCDGGQLERYCRYFVRWRAVENEIALVESTGGAAWKVLGKEELRPVLQALWAESHKLDGALKQVEREFHLTPSARARVGLMNALGEAAKVDNSKERFFTA